MLTAREEREASHNSREQPEPKQAVLQKYHIQNRCSNNERCCPEVSIIYV